jgi:hypothetical protein
VVLPVQIFTSLARHDLSVYVVCKLSIALTISMQESNSSRLDTVVDLLPSVHLPDWAKLSGCLPCEPSESSAASVRVIHGVGCSISTNSLFCAPSVPFGMSVT